MLHLRTSTPAAVSRMTPSAIADAYRLLGKLTRSAGDRHPEPLAETDCRSSGRNGEFEESRGPTEIAIRAGKRRTEITAENLYQGAHGRAELTRRIDTRLVRVVVRLVDAAAWGDFSCRMFRSSLSRTPCRVAFPARTQ